MADSALNEKEEQYLAVASCFLFSKPDVTSLKTHYDKLTAKKYSRGEKIVSRGAVDAGLFLVVTGTVEVAVTGNIFVLLSTPARSYMKSHGAETQRYVLDVVLEGDSFGEELVLDRDTPCSLDYDAKTDCVVLHATSDALKVMIAEDAIFRDRLVMLNNAKRARRDATVQLLHGVAEVMKGSGLLVTPPEDQGAVQMAWPVSSEEAAAAEAAAIKARKLEESNFLLGKGSRVRRSSLSLAGVKEVGAEGSAVVRDRGKLVESKTHERKRNKGMLSSFFNFGKNTPASGGSGSGSGTAAAGAAAGAGEDKPAAGGMGEENEEEEEDNRVTEEDISTLAAMESLAVETENIFALKTNCVDSSQSKGASTVADGKPVPAASKSLFAKRRSSLSKAHVQSMSAGAATAAAAAAAGAKAADK